MCVSGLAGLVCVSVCGWVNALDLIKCSLSAHALIICVVFSIKSLGDMHANYDWLTSFYFTLCVNKVEGSLS